jgi:hypothetical protein
MQGIEAEACEAMAMQAADAAVQAYAVQVEFERARTAVVAIAAPLRECRHVRLQLGAQRRQFPLA